MFSRHKVKISQALHLAAARVAALLHFPAIGVDINRPPHVQWYTLTMHDVAGLGPSSKTAAKELGNLQRFTLHHCSSRYDSRVWSCAIKNGFMLLRLVRSLQYFDWTTGILNGRPVSCAQHQDHLLTTSIRKVRSNQHLGPHKNLGFLEDRSIKWTHHHIHQLARGHHGQVMTNLAQPPPFQKIQKRRRRPRYISHGPISTPRGATASPRVGSGPEAPKP